MAKQKEPKRLCCCGCGKMLSARAERRHRDGQVPPRIAAIQQGQSRHTQPIKKPEEFSMDEGSDRVPSPMDTADDTLAFLDVEADPEPKELGIFPAPINDSVVSARAAVCTEWRTDTRGAVSDDESEEEECDSSHESSEDEFSGLEDDEDDTQSVDDRIEAEWEKEWAEMGASFRLSYTLYHLLIYLHIRKRTYRGRPYVSSCFRLQNRGESVRQVI